MKCEKCGSENVKSIDSRKMPIGVRRRRHCCDCLYRWSTIEIDYEYYKSLERSRGVNIDQIINKGRFERHSDFIGESLEQKVHKAVVKKCESFRIEREHTIEKLNTIYTYLKTNQSKLTNLNDDLGSSRLLAIEDINGKAIQAVERLSAVLHINNNNDLKDNGTPNK